MSTAPFVVLIPARMASTRLPQKPLREIAGRAMVLHVVDRARESGADAVHVATDDERIAAVCSAHGAGIVMTSTAHVSGTERLAEACATLGLGDECIVVNVQGDEPLMPPSLIGQAAALLADDPGASMASLHAPIDDVAELFDPNVVKVVCNASGDALYFSRAPVPWNRAEFAATPAARGVDGHRRHIGLYAYRAAFLRAYVDMTPAPSERLEALEQLRALHHGFRIRMASARERPGPGVDTEADLAAAERIVRARQPASR